MYLDVSDFIKKRFPNERRMFSNIRQGKVGKHAT